MICALYVTTAAQAQISFYGEWCRKGSGEKTIMIFDMKEKKAYVMNEARKTCMVMEEIDKLSTNKLVGYDWEVSHSTSREFLGMEEIDGKECAHYYVKSESIYKDGGKDARLSRMDLLAHEGIELQRLHRPRQYGVCDGQDHRASPRQDGAATGAPLPSARRYQMTVMPAGGLLEMMTGKSCEENTQKVDETRDAIQKSNEQIKEQLKEVNDKSKSDEERMKPCSRCWADRRRNREKLFTLK